MRDLFLGRMSPDLDFTTDADPDATIAVVKKWADTFWEIGRDFGTIGLRKGRHTIEVTTYRAEAYDPDSRKPVVAFGDVPGGRPAPPRLHHQRHGAAAALPGTGGPVRRRPGPGTPAGCAPPAPRDVLLR